MGSLSAGLPSQNTIFSEARKKSKISIRYFIPNLVHTKTIVFFSSRSSALVARAPRNILVSLVIFCLRKIAQTLWLHQNISRVSSVFLVRVYRVCFFYESSILSKNFRSLLIRKLIFGQNFISEIVFLHVVTYIRVPPFSPSDFLCRRCVWFLWNLTGRENAAREKTRLTRALIFRLERTEMNMTTFRYFRKS